MKKVAILLAGGSGERFWPVSRISRPKQLLPLNTNKSLIEEAIDRIVDFVPSEDIFVFTNKITYNAIVDVLKMLPHGNIIPEPLKRNTAPALVYATSFILAKYGNHYKEDEILVGVFTSDQKIHPIEGFRRTIDIAFDYVSKFPKIATIGIVPDRPETAFGYIEVEKSEDFENRSLHEVRCFHEKPDIDTAKRYLESGNYFWNSGMFFWRLDTFLREAKIHMPEIYNNLFPLRKIFEQSAPSNLEQIVEKIEPIYGSFPDISIDYALMEKTQNIVLVKSYFEWDDIGSWDALDRTKRKDEGGNVNIGNNILVETYNSIVFNGSESNRLKVCVVGMVEVVVVATDDAILVCPKSKVQMVKKCVEELKKNPDDKVYL